MAFSGDVDGFLKRFRERADRVAQFYAKEAGNYAVDVTPVITGKLRGGWYMRINTNENLPSLPVDPSGLFTKSLMNATAAKVRWGDAVEIVNNVSYAFFVDQGTAKFAGREMVRRTFEHLRQVRPPR